MLGFNLTTQKTHAEEELVDQRTGQDRRVSNVKTKFPFVDDENRLVLKDRRVSTRRDTDTKKNPLKLLKNKLARN